MAVSAASGVTVPYFQADEQRHRRKIAEWSKEVNQGHIQCIGNLTLAASTVSTVVSDPRVSLTSWIGLEPITANALSARPTVWVSTFGVGTFTLTHASTAATDKTFRYAVLG
jgi:hypothetical protein